MKFHGNVRLKIEIRRASLDLNLVSWKSHSPGYIPVPGKHDAAQLGRQPHRGAIQAGVRKGGGQVWRQDTGQQGGQKAGTCCHLPGRGHRVAAQAHKDAKAG